MAIFQTNKLNIQIDYNKIYDDFKIFTIPLEYKGFKQMGALIKTLKKELNPLGYVLYKNSFICLLSVGYKK